jgi:hypothetical protein
MTGLVGIGTRRRLRDRQCPNRVACVEQQASPGKKRECLARRADSPGGGFRGRFGLSLG